MKTYRMSEMIEEFLERYKRILAGGEKHYNATVKFDWSELNTCKDCPCFYWSDEYKDGTCKVFYDERKEEFGRQLSDFVLDQQEYRPIWCPMILVEK